MDIKRIEARRDIHKRSDEIINKADKLKSVFPESKFASVIYYPFVDEHVNLQSRLKSTAIDVVVFAGGGKESRIIVSTNEKENLEQFLLEELIDVIAGGRSVVELTRDAFF